MAEKKDKSPKKVKSVMAEDAKSAAGSKYTIKQRKDAEALLLTGCSVQWASKQTGIPESTLYGWKKELDPDELSKGLNEKKDEITKNLWSIVDAAQRRIMELLPKASLKEANFILGTSADKLIALERIKKDTQPVEENQAQDKIEITFGALDEDEEVS